MYVLLDSMNTTTQLIGDGLTSIKELLRFREDAVIEQDEDISSLFMIYFGRNWSNPSSTVMEEAKITFCGCGISPEGLLWVRLSTHKQEADN